MNKFGFSLIELLVAMSISFLIMFLAVYSHNQYSRYWNKSVTDFDAQMEEVKATSFIFKVINNIRPHMVKDEKGEWFHYFEGGNVSIKSVTSSALSNPESAAVFELAFIIEEDISFIEYKEKLVDKEPFIMFSDDIDYTLTKRIPFDFNTALFEYYGWTHADRWYENIEQNNMAQEMRWFGFYSARDTRIPPNAVKLSFDRDSASSLVIGLSHFVPEQLEYNRQDDS